jgi:uncharacterized protein with LGFP repeats
MAAAFGGVLASVTGAGQRALAQMVLPRAAELHGPLDGVEVRVLPFAARDVAVHWAGNPNAQVSIAFSVDGVNFGSSVDAGRDEVGAQRRNGETYGAILPADGATAVRISTDRPIARVSVLALDESPFASASEPSSAAASVSMPAVIPRTGSGSWGADESLRFVNGTETWPSEFFPLQKCVVHHTATRNGDSDPAATVRSIYYYHCVTQGWGDIGYTFLIDEQGRIYKGRNSHAVGDPYGPDTITGEDALGSVITAGHALGVNQGSMGVAFLGTLTSRDATAAAKSSLVNLLAWECDHHDLDPHGITDYVDPDGSTSPYTPTQPIPNILGHRDVNATECPGDKFYPTLPSVRDAVATRIAVSSDTEPPTVPTGLAVGWTKNRFQLTWTASTDAGTGVASYQVYRSTTQFATFLQIGSSSQTSYNDSTVDRKTKTVWYRVRATDRAGNQSALSDAVMATRP